MKILFYGDSITDAGRDYATDHEDASYGNGYVKYIVENLQANGYAREDLINRGISGNRIVDLYSRIKVDCWNHNPDFISILIGVNDVWHEVEFSNGVEPDRFEKMYRILIEDTKAKLPGVKFLLMEPFVLKGAATVNEGDKWERFLEVYNYAAIVKKLAEEYGLPFLPLQDKFTAAENAGTPDLLSDGVHPAENGAKLIAEEWLKLFSSL